MKSWDNKYRQRFKSIKDRFWEKVVIRSDDECWEWMGSKDKDGYGYFWSGERIKAHRYSWILHNGKMIPNNLFICHHCDTPECVNPKHLFLGTNHDNQMDAMNKGRDNFVYGERQGNSKLTEEDVKEIRFLHSSGNYTYSKLSDMYGVGFQHIERIVHRKRWAWLN